MRWARDDTSNGPLMMAYVFLFLIAADTVEPSASPPKEAATYTPFPTTALSMVIHTKEEKHAKIIMIVTSMNLFIFILI